MKQKGEKYGLPLHRPGAIIYVVFCEVGLTSTIDVQSDATPRAMQRGLHELIRSIKRDRRFSHITHFLTTMIFKRCDL
jgi:hypothetical protein